MLGVFEKNDIKVLVKKAKGIDGFTPMFHPHIEIIYIISGSVSITIDGVSKKIKSGDLGIVFPYSVHSYQKSKDAELILILLAPASAGVFEKTLLTNKPIKPFIKADITISTLLGRIADLEEKKNDISQKTLSGYIVAVLGEILSNLSMADRDNTRADVMQNVLIYCSEHFSENISVKAISDALFISKSYVSKIFSSKLKIPFREYINELRIAKAKKLLLETDKKIIDIMYECGFQNQSSFNRVFYKYCNMPPLEYKQSNKQKKRFK